MSDFMLPLVEALDSGNADDEMYRECLNNRILLINTDIDDDIIDSYELYIFKWNAEDRHIPVEDRQKIRIFINSVGGDTFSATNLADVILNSKTPVVGIGLSLVASASFHIYLACHERVAFYNTVFLQHDGSITISNSSSKAKQTMAFFDTMEKRNKEYVLSRTNMDSDFYDSIFDEEYYFYPDHGKELGVVHKIIGEDIELIDIL